MTTDDNSKHLFQPKFQHTYTLAPILEQGVDALACTDIPGIQEAKLIEIEFQLAGPYQDRQIYRSADFFASSPLNLQEHSRGSKLVAAVFLVKLESNQRPCRLKIITPNLAEFENKEGFNLIKTWMRQRGFMKAASRKRKPGLPVKSPSHKKKFRGKKVFPSDSMASITIPSKTRSRVGGVGKFSSGTFAIDLTLSSGGSL